ncbi:MAG: hypothetical protein FJZ16_03475 [Candidatus Omnitrophica bacterium]|nr:hypothetical protein [Candidatus Omnitrophota bacterium]
MKKLALIITGLILFDPFLLLGEEPKIIETVKIYTNGYRGIVKDGNITYYKQEGDLIVLVNDQALAQELIDSGGAKLILEAEVKQYGSNTNNVNVLIGGYEPTFITGDTWNRNSFSVNSIKNIMNNQEGIAVIVSYDTHWDYGGPGSEFNKSLQGAFKNLMNQTEYDLKSIGMTENTTTITSYSTGHYLAMDYLTDQTKTEFNITEYNAVAPNLKGSVLENYFQKLEGGRGYDDIIKNSAYTAILNSNPYFRDNVAVNAYITTEDFAQDTSSKVYYSDADTDKGKLEDIIGDCFWQVKNDLFKLYLPPNTTHTNEERIYSQLYNEYLPYYYKDQSGNIAYYDTKILLELKKDQLTLQRNTKQYALSQLMQNAPCGAKTQEMTDLNNEIDLIEQEIAQIEGQLGNFSNE